MNCPPQDLTPLLFTQLAKVDHWLFCATSIQDRISAHDEILQNLTSTNHDGINPVTGMPREVRYQFQQVYTGSRLAPKPLELVEESHGDNPVFTGFCVHLNKFLMQWFNELPDADCPDLPTDSSGHIRINL